MKVIFIHCWNNQMFVDWRKRKVKHRPSYVCLHTIFIRSILFPNPWSKNNGIGFSIDRLNINHPSSSVSYIPLWFHWCHFNSIFEYQTLWIVPLSRINFWPFRLFIGMICKKLVGWKNHLVLKLAETHFDTLHIRYSLIITSVLYLINKNSFIKTVWESKYNLRLYLYAIWV